jgi:conjugative transfer signal peptidase TraF
MSGRQLAYTAWGFAALFWAAVQVADSAGIRINHTPSLAPGLWRITPLQEPLRRGQIVSFCPPDAAVIYEARARGYLGAGRCPGAVEPLLKRVEALASDLVVIDAAGVAVNGIRLVGTSPLEADGQGRRIAGIGLGSWVIGADAFWAGSAHQQGFDSRYFGPVPISHVLGVARPLSW